MNLWKALTDNCHSDLLLILDVAMDSPLVMDISCMDTNEGPAAEPIVDPELTLYCLQEYQEDIHNHLRESEKKLRPKVLSYFIVYAFFI